MSTRTIPDLWGESLKPTVRSPVAILRAQANALKGRTDGILEGEVRASGSRSPVVRIVFDLSAPALDYKVRLLVVHHRSKQAYPAAVTSDFLKPDALLASLAPKPADHLHSALEAAVGPSFDEPPVKGDFTAHTDDEFIHLVKLVFQSHRVQGLLQSLVARSNDLSDPELVEEADNSGVAQGQEPPAPEPPPTASSP